MMHVRAFSFLGLCARNSLTFAALRPGDGLGPRCQYYRSPSVASVVGIVLSLIQAITQLQEQTLAFGVKLLAVGLTLFLMGKWLSGEILQYSEDIFNRFYLL